MCVQRNSQVSLETGWCKHEPSSISESKDPRQIRCFLVLGISEGFDSRITLLSVLHTSLDVCTSTQDDWGHVQPWATVPQFQVGTPFRSIQPFISVRHTSENDSKPFGFHAPPTATLRTNVLLFFSFSPMRYSNGAHAFRSRKRVIFNRDGT
jgi:hypothetical protein